MSESKVPRSSQSSQSPPESPDAQGEGMEQDRFEGAGGSMTEQIAQLTAELEQAQARALRAQADLENFRKRVRRDMDDERKYAALPLLRDLLPVLDNLDRALEARSEDSEAFREGVRIVASQMASVLQQHNCQRIEAEGELFDPNLHEAIAQQPSPETPEGTVVAVAKTGYRLHDRVIRPSQVVVSTGAGGDQQSETGQTQQPAANANHEQG